MAEEMVTKFKCDRCRHTEEVRMEPGLFGGVRKAKPPASWGPDLLNKNVLCAQCYAAYKDEYMHWYETFMNKKRKLE